MRKAYTLVEVCVVSALAVVLTGMLLVVQQSTSRRTVTTDRKRDAAVRAHRAYEAVHQLLASSPRYDVTTPPAESDDAGFDEDGAPAPTAPPPGVSTSRGRLAFDPVKKRLAVDKTSIDGLGAVTFIPESDNLLAFVVDSGPADSPRERSQLYGKQYFEPADASKEFKTWAAKAKAHPLPFAGSFSFQAPCGYRPDGEEVDPQ